MTPRDEYEIAYREWLLIYKLKHEVQRFIEESDPLSKRAYQMSVNLECQMWERYRNACVELGRCGQ